MVTGRAPIFFVQTSHVLIEGLVPSYVICLSKMTQALRWQPPAKESKELVGHHGPGAILLWMLSTRVF